VAPLIVKADLKHPPKRYTGGESDLKILIVVTLTMKVDKVVVRFIVCITLCRGLVKLRKQLRLGRDGYPNTIII
jgi:hypothetical protein